MYQNINKRKFFSFLLSLLLTVTFSATSFLLPYSSLAWAAPERPALTGQADTAEPPVNKGKPAKDVVISPPDDLPKKPGETRTEIPSQRSEYSKRFLNPDGTFTEEISAEPIFFKDRNKWVPIENNLISSAGGIFNRKNKANTFTTLFGPNGKVRYQTKDGWVEFQPVDVPANALDLASSNKVKYFKIYNETDIEYTVQNSGLKEDIILSGYTGKNTFAFEVNTNRLSIKKDPETGLLIIYNRDNQPVAQFDRPFMEDAAGEISPNVTLDFSQQNGKDLLILTADADWLSDSHRQFPIKIDPTLSKWDIHKDTFVASYYPNNEFSSYTYMGSGNSTWGILRSFAQFVLPNLPSGSKITNAQMGFYQFQNSISATVDMYRITSNWTASATTWYNQPSTAATPESSVTSSSYNTYWYFPATELVKKWYSMGSSTYQNYGVMLKHQNEAGALKLFRTVNNGTNTPVITIDYIVDPTGAEGFWSFDKGVNVFNGNLLVNSTDTGMPGRGSIGFSRTYNSRSGNSGVLGYGWTGNVFSYIKPNIYGPVMLVDEDGTEHIFKRNTDGTYTPPPGLFLDLVKNADNSYTVTRMDGTIINFNPNGKITDMMDSNGNTSTFTYDPTTGRLANVKDTVNRATSFTYDANGRIQTITDPANRAVTYTYDVNGNLTQVNFNGNTVTYGYDANHNLTSVTDPRNNNTTLVYDTTNDRVQSITSNITVNGAPTPSTTTFSYTANQTTVTNANNIPTVYDYDDEGKVNRITVDPTGENISTSFGYDDDKNVTQVTDPKGGISTADYEDGKGNLITATNANNEPITIDYDSQNNPVQVTDPAGNISTAEYDTGNNNTDNADPILQATASKYNSYGNPQWETAPITATDNLAYNPSSESGPNQDNVGNDWFTTTQSGTTATFAWEDTAKFGNKSVSIANPTGEAAILNNRSIAIDFVNNPQDTYVISGYVKTENIAQEAAYVEVQAYNSNGDPLSIVTSAQVGGTQDWQRLYVVVNKDNLPTGTASIKAGFGAKNTTGKAYFDGLQFEAGNIMSTYNLVENSGMEVDTNSDNMPDNWTGYLLNPTTDKLDTANKLVGNKSFKIVGAAGVNKYITQRVNVKGDQNSKLTVSGWAYADNPDPNGGWWLVQTRINYTDGTEDWTNANDFDKSKPNEWQHVAAYVTPIKPFSSIDVYYYFYNQRGNVWFDAMKLQEGDIITAYQYDANNNFTTSITSAAGTVSYGYDSYGNQNKVTDVMGNVTDFNFDPLNRLTKVTQPTIMVNGQPTRYETNYGYDANGNRITVTDAKNHTTSYGYNEWNQVKNVTDAINNTVYHNYDILGRNTGVQYPNGNTVSFGYDNIDRLTSLQGNWIGGSHRYRFNYDDNGNVTSVVDEINNKTTSYKFNPNNMLFEMTEPCGNVVSYVYDDLGQITGLTASVGGTNYTTNYSYDTLGQPTKVDAGSGNNASYYYDENGSITGIKLGNGIRALNSYDPTGRLAKLNTFDPYGILMRGFTYSYNGNGNIIQITMDGSVSGNVYYTYDTLNRLTSETLLDGTLIEYQYDAVGNRTLKKVNGSPTAAYLYDAANQLTSVNEVVYSYDANGNMTSDGSRDFVYDAANRLIQVKNHATQTSIASFEYDAFDRRTSMTTVNGVVYFHYDGKSGRVLYETDSNNNIRAKYIYDNNGNRISIVFNGQTYFYQYNGYGHVIALTDTNGTVVASYDYDTFGNLIGNSPAPGSVGDVNPYRYAGYRYDKEIDLYYLNARYYWSVLGRFITRDTILGVNSEPLSFNLYLYGNCNPVTYIDPSGHWPVWGKPYYSFSAYNSLDTGDLIARTLYGEVGSRDLRWSILAIAGVIGNRLRTGKAGLFGMKVY